MIILRRVCSQGPPRQDIGVGGITFDNRHNAGFTLPSLSPEFQKSSPRLFHPNQQRRSGLQV